MTELTSLTLWEQIYAEWYSIRLAIIVSVPTGIGFFIGYKIAKLTWEWVARAFTKQRDSSWPVG